MASKLDFDLQSNKYIEIEKHYSIFNYYTVFNEIHSLLDMHNYSSNKEFNDSKFIKLLNTFQVKYNIDDDVKERIQTFYMMRSLDDRIISDTHINSYLQNFYDIMKHISLDDFNTPNTVKIDYEKLNINEFKDQPEINKAMKFFFDAHLKKLLLSKSPLTSRNIEQFTSLIKSFYYQLNITDKWTKMLCNDESNLIIIPCFFNDDTFSDYESYIQSMGGRIRKHYKPESNYSYIKTVLDFVEKKGADKVKEPFFYKGFSSPIPEIKGKYNDYMRTGKVKTRTVFTKFISKNVYFLKCIPNSAMKDDDYELKLKGEISKLESFIQKRFMDFLDSKSRSGDVVQPIKKIILFYNDDNTLSTIMYGKNLNSQTIHGQINKYLIKLLTKIDDSIDIKSGIQQRRIQTETIQLNDNLMVTQFDKLKQKRVFLDILRDKDPQVSNLYETFFNFYVFIIKQYHDSLIRNDSIKLIEKVNDSIKHFKIRYSTKMINEDLYNIDKIVINKNQKYTLELDDLEMFELEGYFQSKIKDQYKFKLNRISNCKPLQAVLDLFNESDTRETKNSTETSLSESSISESSSTSQTGRPLTKAEQHIVIRDYVNSLKNRKMGEAPVTHSKITEIKNMVKQENGFSNISSHKIDLVLYLIVNNSRINLVVNDYDYSFKLYVYNNRRNVIEFVHNGDLRHSRIKNVQNQVLLLRSLNKQLPMLSNIYYYPNFKFTTQMITEYLKAGKPTQNKDTKSPNISDTKSKIEPKKDETSLSNSLLNILSSQEKLHELFVYASLHKRYNKYIYDDGKDRSKIILRQIISLCLVKGNSFYMQKPKEDEKKVNSDILTDSGFSAYKINNISNISVTDREANVKIHLIPSKELKDQEEKSRSCEEKKKRITKKFQNSFGKMLKNATRKYHKQIRRITT